MALIKDTAIDLEELNEKPPEELFAWAYELYGDRAGILTSFQDTGCVMIDMAQRVAPGIRVLTVDSLRLHQETYDLIKRMEAHYGIEVERYQPDPNRVRQMIERHGEYLFFDSKPKQEYCCHIRKVEPNERALDTLDVWFTGLRHGQSDFRKGVRKVTQVKRGERQLIKVSPLATWTDQEVWDYIKAHDVPYNPLYEQGYTSIGCYICTTPTLPGEDKRAGRWRWFNSISEDKKECGIHTFGSGI